MAKGQQRSGREAKKPKKDKDKSTSGGSAYQQAQSGAAAKPFVPGQKNPGSKPPGSK